MKSIPSHTVRAADGGKKTLHNYARRQAIVAHCTECCGWEMHPRDCTAKHCALYPFRAKTFKTRQGDSTHLNHDESTPHDVSTGSEAQSSPYIPKASPGSDLSSLTKLMSGGRDQ